MFRQSGSKNKDYKQAPTAKVTEVHITPVLRDITKETCADTDEYDRTGFLADWNTVKKPITADTVLEFNKDGCIAPQISIGATTATGDGLVRLMTSR